MSNMSYCRFENTVNDLRDCEEALDNLFKGEGTGDDKLSEREREAAVRLIQICERVTNDMRDRMELDAVKMGDDILQRCDDEIGDAIEEAGKELERGDAEREAAEAEKE